MTEVFISFKADSPDELMQIILNFALKKQTPPSWLGAPLDAEAKQAEAEARERIDAEDAAEDAAARGNGADPEPDEPGPPASEPPARRARRSRVSAPAAPAPAPAAPAPAQAPVDNFPPLDTLKAVVTAAVRLAQKGEGSKTILDLLPAFKDTTGLAFVMNAEDKHRGALYDLVQAAGLSVV